MVGTLVRLQLKLFGRSLNRSPGATIGTLIAGLFGLVMVLLVAKSCYQGRHAALELRGLIAIGLLSVLMAARLFALFIVGQEQTLEPSRFALFPVSGRQLAPGLFVASFLTLGGALSVLLVLASSLIWAPNLLLLGGWIVVGLLGICLSTLLNQVVAAKLAGMLHSRRFRDINTAVVGIAAAFSGVLVQVMISAFSVQNLSDIGRFRMAGLIVGWTPFGWPFAALVDLASGAWVAGAIRLVLTASSIGGLWWLWQRELAAALVSPIDAGGPSQQVKGSFPDRITPSTPAGAIAARMLRYYRRDPRSLVQGLVMGLLPLIALAPSLINGAGPQDNFLTGRGGLFFVIFGALMLGIGSSQQIGYDGSAIWMHVVSGISGRVDRLGRVIAFLIFAGPLVCLMTLVVAVVSHNEAHFVNFLVAGLGALLVGAAVGLVVGAMYQIAMPPPGSSPFARNPGGGFEGAIYQLVGMFVSVVLVAPVGIISYFAWSRWVWLLAGLAFTVIWGGGLVWAGIAWGGRILDRTWPEVLARMTRQAA